MWWSRARERERERERKPSPRVKMRKKEECRACGRVVNPSLFNCGDPQLLSTRSCPPTRVQCVLPPDHGRRLKPVSFRDGYLQCLAHQLGFPRGILNLPERFNKGCTSMVLTIRTCYCFCILMVILNPFVRAPPLCQPQSRVVCSSWRAVRRLAAELTNGGSDALARFC